MYSSQPSQQSQYHIQTSTFPSQPEIIKNWTKLLYKRSRSAQDRNKIKTKHSKESEHYLNQTSTSNRYTALLEEESEDQQHKTSLENTRKPPVVYKVGVKNISLLIQLLQQIEIQQYETEAFPDSQAEVQLKTSEWYRKIVKALAEKSTEFRTYKLKEERSYKVVLKNMNYSINPQEIETEIENLGHMVTNIWNAKQYTTELPLYMFL
jgi:hypothetical protein